MKEKYFKTIVPMPEFGIKKDDIIIRGETGRYSTAYGRMLPLYLKLDSCVMLPIEQHYCAGDIVIPNQDKLSKSYPKGMYVVRQFLPRQLNYELVPFEDRNISYSSSRNARTILLKEKDFTKAVTYWFINSSGKFMETYVGKDPDADRWRIKNSNYFHTKEEAQHSFEKIMNEQ